MRSASIYNICVGMQKTAGQEKARISGEKLDLFWKMRNKMCNTFYDEFKRAQCFHIRYDRKIPNFTTFLPLRKRCF
jgi:hypothetical protein